MRIGGLASGMDTEQIVKDLMRVQRMPVDKLKQQKQKIVWQRDAYRELNTMMDKFRNNIFDTVMRSAVMNSKRVSSSNSNLITATATAAAANGSFSISRVDRLATAASNVSASSISKGPGKIDPTKALTNQEFGTNIDWKNGTVRKQNESLTTAKSTVDLQHKNLVADASEISVKVDGKQFTVVTDADKVLDDNEVFLNRANGNATLDFKKNLPVGTRVNVTYVTESTDKYFTSSIETFNSEGKPQVEKFAFQGDRSLNQVIQEINASGAGVSMFYDSFTDKVTVQRKETGNFNTTNPGDTSAARNLATSSRDAAIAARNAANQFTDPNDPDAITAADVATAAEIKATEDEEAALIAERNSGKEMLFSGVFFNNVLKLSATTEKGGENAEFTINGLATERQSNTFSINGVTFTLKNTFDDAPVNLTISTDTEKIFDTIKGFVEGYNELLEKVNGKLKEDRHREYLPLTDEQKESMSEKDIERWEERAMSGLLRRDPLLSAGLDRLRLQIYNPVKGLSDNSVIRQLTDLGITTSKDFNERGKLEINEAKLKEAIERDPEAVFQLFAADGPTNSDKGIARRMREGLQDTMRSVSERAGGTFGKLQNHQFTLGRNINDIDSRINNFERRLKQVENRYWKQFTAMEKTMKEANSQMEQMFSMLFSNQGQ